MSVLTKKKTITADHCWHEIFQCAISIMSTCFVLKIFIKVPRMPNSPVGLTMSSPAHSRAF